MKFKLFFLLPIAFLCFSFSSYALFTEVLQEEDPFVIVLDAGHGGHDPGNLGNGYLEKNIALNIVLKVGAILEQNKDIKVIYTRKDDTFIDLFVRGEIANKANADLFVSVHCDSHTSDAHGAGTFVLGLHANKQNFEIAKKENSVIYLEDNYETRYANYDINSPESVIGLTIMQEEFLDQSIALAKIMQENFSVKLKRNDRKVKQAGFIVLHQTFMPSVLVETGFLTNKEEGAYLNSKQGQSKIGSAIASAIIKYKEQVPSKTSKNNAIGSTPIKNPPVPIEKEKVIEEPKKVVEKVVPKVENKKEPIVVNKEEVAEVKEKEIVKPTKEVIRSSSGVRTKVEEKEIPEVKKEIETPKPVVVKKNYDIIFKVQLLASGKNIALEAENFNGLNDLSKEPVKSLFRYMYGNTESYQKVKLLKKNADLKGYTSSYIVAYKDGVRIPVEKALAYISE
ncbi:N-acetylmuramoyl-L-alanine amidase [Maribacter vaceletii]|uniref:N-acetylmuramoyl-L-alanine amidase n=1 Tax=Maribacter vaceletii TaxID=1206816 RepID=A0A495DSR7_9FLAO|nr:N-acetylmuramoyl-L-alanine amidase [Maribacter vaceletii]RKR07158.1 N-acetylmuramoyl-L-alanine amidase [Maribacter vaceletii]